jgi:hypothetical protein
MQHKYPEYQTIAAGDYNVCLKKNDSLNRNRSNVEECLADTIVNNNKITNLVDSYRSMHKDGGYTWKRGTCYSRLDYIFISNELLSSLNKAEQNWAYEASDHAALSISIKQNNTVTKGPGIIKVNTKILENPSTVSIIKNEVKLMMEQIDESWNPHAKLEFLR